MNIDPEQTIAGVPSLELRSFFREHRLAEFFSEAEVRQYWECSHLEAADLIRKLQSEGFVQPYPQVPNAWALTIGGNALALASAAPRITRDTANHKLAEILQRVEQVNEEKPFAFRVQRLGVFGSYLTVAKRLSDVDIAFELVAKESDADRQQALCNARINEALREGRCFGNFILQLNWPREEVLRFLKARCRSYSFHDFSDAQAIGAEVKLVYPPEEAQLSLPPTAANMQKTKKKKVRRFRVTATEEVQLSGCRIVKHPEEGFECFKVGKKYFQPTIVWMEYIEDPVHPHWSTLDHDCALDQAGDVFNDKLEEIPPVLIEESDEGQEVAEDSENKTNE